MTRDFPCPSNQTIKTSLVKPDIARDPAGVQRFGAAPWSITPASLELARFSRGQFGLVICQGGVVKLLIAIASVFAMRAVECSISDELELIVRRTSERDVMIFAQFPARHVVGWRDCVLAIRAIPGLVAVGASSDYDIRPSVGS